MTRHERRYPFWAGRSLALVAIVLLALNLRAAVAAISPITEEIGVDIPLDGVAIGALGMLPPMAFAVSGLIAPAVARRLGLEATVALAAATMTAGHLLRAASSDYGILYGASVLTLVGMGFGNILLPPVVKHYFPDRIGLVTSLFGTLLAVGTAVPAVSAAPLAHLAGWRVSLGTWALLALAALVPWLVLWLRDRAARRADAPEIEPEVSALEVEAPNAELIGRLWRSPTAWAIALALGISAFNAYALFAWLPELLVETAGSSAVEAGAQVALYGLIGLPFAVLVPPIAVRMRNVGLLVHLGVAFFLSGYLGLLLAPAAASWLWVTLAGSGPLLFAVAMVLISLRTRSATVAVALSGFVQGVGYTVGALGPLLVGVLRESSGGWVAPLLALAAFSALASAIALMLRRPRYVEDELAERGAGAGPV